MPGLSEFSSGYGLDESITKSGKRKAEAEEQALDIGQQQFDIAKNLYALSGPVRNVSAEGLSNFVNTGLVPNAYNGLPASSAPRLQNFLDTGELPTPLHPAARPSVPDLTALSRDTLERQFGRAREATISQAGAQGGHLASALSDLEGTRALGVTGLYNQQNALQYQQDSAAADREDALRKGLYSAGLDFGAADVAAQRQQRQQLFAQALGVGFQDSGLALSGLSGASNTYGNVASLALAESLEKQKRAQEKAAAWGSFATGGGGGGSGGGGGGKGG